MKSNTSVVALYGTVCGRQINMQGRGNGLTPTLVAWVGEGRQFVS